MKKHEFTKKDIAQLSTAAKSISDSMFTTAEIAKRLSNAAKVLNKSLISTPDLIEKLSVKRDE